MQVKRLNQLFSAGEIEERVRDIAARINNEYSGEALVLICVLKGAFMFFSDLVKHITVAPELDFVRVASYGNSDASAGTISFSKDVETPLADKHVVLVEDIVDTGHSMHFLLHQLAPRGAKSLRIAALIDKYERREVDVKVDFAGFSLTSGFVVGYGLDYAERYRELPALYTAEL